MAAKRRTQPATANGIPTSTGGKASFAWFVSTHDLREIIEPLLDRLNDSLNGGETEKDEQENIGAHAAVAGRVALTVGYKHGSAERMLHRVKASPQRSVACELADAILMAFGLRIEDAKGLPHFPSNINSAADQVRNHIEFVEKRVPTDAEVEELARTLLRFGEGYVADGSDEAFDRGDYHMELDRVAAYAEETGVKMRFTLINSSIAA